MGVAHWSERRFEGTDPATQISVPLPNLLDLRVCGGLEGRHVYSHHNGVVLQGSRSTKPACLPHFFPQKKKRLATRIDPQKWKQLHCHVNQAYLMHCEYETTIRATSFDCKIGHALWHSNREEHKNALNTTANSGWNWSLVDTLYVSKLVRNCTTVQCTNGEYIHPVAEEWLEPPPPASTPVIRCQVMCVRTRVRSSFQKKHLTR